jgi:ubiquinone/menaquinone biosynthesis C-methylase UbiE
MNCDPIARHYEWMEFAVFGRKLEYCRTHFLPELLGTRRALVLGDGDGRFLTRLLDAAPSIEADYVDRSAKMLELARRRAGDDRVRYRQTDALTGELPSGDFDLVAAHFFFDCFERGDLQRVIGRVRVAAPEARWLVSEFRVPETRWFAGPARWWIGLMYRFFALTTGLRTPHLEDHRPLLRAAGLRPVASAERLGGLLVSELWAVE